MSARLLPRTLERLYAAALRLYPRAFREAYGAEMAWVFHEKCERAAGAGLPALIRQAGVAWVDAVACGCRERFGPRPMPTDRHAHRDSPQRGPFMFDTLRDDWRQAFRGLRRQPTFALSVMLTLGVAMAAVTTVLTLVDGAVLRPLPYPDAHRLVALVQQDPRFGRTPFPPAFLADLRDRTRTFDSVAGFSPSWATTVSGTADPHVVFGCYVTDGLLELIGAAPIAGRTFTPQEYASAGSRSMLVRADYWEQTFGRGVALNGQTLRLNGEPYTIVGILPADLRMAITASAVASTTHSAQFWLPFANNQYAGSRTIPVMNVIARLEPGASEAQADAGMPALAASLTRDYSSLPRTLAIDAVPLAAMVSENARQVLFLLLGAVGCLLLIALANVTNLLLVRSASRLNDMFVRTSLGATRWHVIRFMLIESCVLSCGGASIGLLLTTWTIGILPTLNLGALPPTTRLQIDLMELAGAAALAVAGGLTMGLLPALRTSRQAQATAHTPDGVRVIDGGGAIRSAIVVLEVALAIVLLVGGGLLARSFWMLMHVEAGFDASRTLTASIAMPATRYPSPERLRVFVDTLLADVRTLPGVERAAFVNRLPLGGGNVLVGVEVAGRPGEPITVDRRVMTDDYFDTLGIRLAEGRTFGPQDRADSQERVAIVNTAASRRLWPDGQALGRQLRLMLQSGPGPWLTVVGVSGDIRHHGLDKPAEAEVYVPFNQAGVNSGVLLVRSGVDPTSLGRAVAERLRRIDPELPLDQIQPMSAVVDRSIATPRLRTLIFNGLGALALLLAATGLFGVLSYLVTIRTRDIGVRIALGAEPRHLFRLVVGGGLKLTAIGAMAGLLASLAAARGLTSVLFGVSPYDPAAFAGAAGVLLLVTMMATLLPLRRAIAMDPVRALRGE